MFGCFVLICSCTSMWTLLRAPVKASRDDKNYPSPTLCRARRFVSRDGFEHETTPHYENGTF